MRRPSLRGSGKARIVPDTIVVHAAHAGIVPGARHRREVDMDLRGLGTILKRNVVVEDIGFDAGVLDNPATGILWLAQRLAGYGRGLKAGEDDLSGSFARVIEARPAAGTSLILAPSDPSLSASSKPCPHL